MIEKRGGDRRRRECTACPFRFTTFEILASDLQSLRDARRKLDQLAEVLSAPSDDQETRPAGLDIPL